MPLFFIANIFVDALRSLLNLFPDVEFTVFTVPEFIKDIITTAWFFLPMDTITSIFIISFVITVIRVILSIIFRVKSFIPTMGD